MPTQTPASIGAVERIPAEMLQEADYNSLQLELGGWKSCGPAAIGPPVFVCADPEKPTISLMDLFVACGTQREQVIFRIVTLLAAELSVVDLEIGHRSTRLTTPAIPLEHLLA